MPDLSDPRMAQTVARMAGAMTRAMMDMPVGEIEAAAQGRVPTAADHGRRLGDIAPPGIDREVERETAHNGAQMQAMGKAMAVAVPGIIRSLEHAAREAQRAAGTLPDPTYPRR